MRQRYKILLVPAASKFLDQMQMEYLGRALRELGHDVDVTMGPVRDSVLPGLCRSVPYDIVFRVNRNRSSYTPLPKGVRHVGWFQDFHYGTEKKEFPQAQPGDIIYFLGEPRACGVRGNPKCMVGVLYHGVNHEIPLEAKAQPHDISLCGYIPGPRHPAEESPGRILLSQLARVPVRVALKAWRAGKFKTGDLTEQQLIRRTPGLLSDFQHFVELTYAPLGGSLDVHELYRGLVKIARRHYSPFLPVSSICEIDLLYFSTHYPRLLDRQLLVRRSMNVSTYIALFGPGWELHPEFRPFHRGIVDNPLALYGVYRSSRLNLSNNTHGMGINSRSLECMHAAAALMTHSSPHDEKPGGLASEFEPGVHYIQFTTSNLEEVAQRWLCDERGRQALGERARAQVVAKHLWIHRARQLLDDLQRA